VIDKLLNEADIVLKEEFNKIDRIEYLNSKKILDAFIKNRVSEAHLGYTTGYGYNDIGRDIIENIYSDIFKAEDALVRCQLISGTHAITTCFFGILRPGDTLLSITGKPYDTLDEVIGLKDNPSSLASYGINYQEIDLIDNKFAKDKIKEELENNKIKMITIQRSRGYSSRNSITIDVLEDIISYIRGIDKEVIIMIDNCYCELVNEKEPIEVGADIIAGSLIKNMGGSIASNGGYIVGRKDLIELCANYLNVPGQGKEVGPTLNQNRYILQGLYIAPMIVANALKTNILTAYLLENLGYKVNPKYNEEKADIVLSIMFNDEDKLIKYISAIQHNSKIDSYVDAIPTDMPGYDDKIIMASGSFSQGSSIELSCDGPIRSPYIAYQQGGISYNYGKIIITRAILELLKQ